MHVDSWFKGNKLSLDVMKTHSMPTSTKPKLKALKSKNEFLRIKILLDELEVVQKTKSLCVQIDYSLDLKEHIKSLRLRFQKQLGFKGMLNLFYQKRHLRPRTQELLDHFFATV